MTLESESKRLIDEASEIRKSGRWDSMNQTVKHLADYPAEHEAWKVQVLAAICAQNFSEYLALKAVYESEAEPSLLAWRARNLLEISVWAIYCSSSKENARAFYEEAGRDVTDIFKAFIKWGKSTSQEADWFSPIEKAKQDVSKSALSEGIESLDGAYKRVSDIAEKCGLGPHYITSYKMLSKFCHPTAMLIMAIPDSEKEKLQKDIFHYYGCMFFVGGFTALEGCLSLMVQKN